jgi:hypothetical protein
MFENIKSGDEIAYKYSRHFDWQIVTVEKVTSTQIHLSDDLKFRRADASQILRKGEYGSACIAEATPELRTEMKETVERREYLKIVERISWRQLPIEKLRQIAALLEGEQIKQ